MFKNDFMEFMAFSEYENDLLINKVADRLALSPNDTIETEEFIETCISCGVDPDSFTERDFDKLQRRLNKIT